MILDKQSIRELLESRFKDQKISTLKNIPLPSSLLGVKTGARRVVDALKSGELITVVGDYDVDGVVSSVILKEFLDFFGSNLEVLIPHRIKDGYGINPEIVKRAKGSLIITVDNGISAVDAAKIAKELGKELIITDHHIPPSVLPDAFSIINPKQEGCNFLYKNICGAEVAWYFCAGIKEELGVEFRLDGFLELLGIAIVADVMPLLDLNRVFLKAAISRLGHSKRAAFVAYKQRFGTIDYESLSFGLIPMLNSAGRIDSAMIAFRFLSAKTPEEANFFLDKLVMLNNKRKDIEKEVLEDALKQVEEDKPFIAVHKEGWHEGVIGIVSSRLLNKFNKSAFVFSQTTDIAKGSVRAVEGVNIIEEIGKHKELLKGYGGHRAAAGISLDNSKLEPFKNALLESYKHPLQEKKSYDGVLDPEMIDDELLDILEEFEPYGEGCPSIKFLSNNFFVSNIKEIGANKSSLMLELQTKTKKFKGFKFFAKKDEIQVGSYINCIYVLNRSEYAGKREIRVLLKEIFF